MKGSNTKLHEAWVVLKGDISNVKLDNHGDFNSIVKCTQSYNAVGERFSDGAYHDYSDLNGDALAKDNWEFICTVEEFEGYCEKMKPIVIVDEDSLEYKLTNIGDILHNLSCSMTSENEQDEYGKYAVTCWDAAIGMFKSNSGLAQNPSPMYTQATCDAGELPKVGSECIIHYYHTSHSCCITYMGDSVGCYKLLSDGSEFSFVIADVKFTPIMSKRDRVIANALYVSLCEGQCYTYLKASLEKLYDAKLLV
jgi:hypothetical protein